MEITDLEQKEEIRTVLCPLLMLSQENKNDPSCMRSLCAWWFSPARKSPLGCCAITKIAIMVNTK